MTTARNLAEMKAALGMQPLMMQNVMIGTVEGDIYYVRAGRVPVRPAGYDYKRAMPGNTSKAEWQGIHPLDDLVQITNPPQGYMQNCNVSPQFLMKDCPLRPNPERPYLFNGFAGFDKLDQAYDNPLHQRAAMCVDLLHDVKRMTIEDAIEIAMSPAVYGADAWQQRLRKAWSGASADLHSNKELAALYEVIINWNRRCDADATGAVAYQYWKAAFGKDIAQADRAGLPPSADLSDDVLLAKLGEANAKLRGRLRPRRRALRRRVPGRP